MHYYGQMSIALLIVLILLSPGIYSHRQTSAQTNESVKLLITDAIEDLQNGDTNGALTHSNLAPQELSSSAGNSSSVESAQVLLDDAIQDLQNGDTDAAQTHLNLVSQQLGILNNDTSSRPVDIAKTSDSITKNTNGTSNATGGPVFNFLTFEEPDSGVKLQYPSVLGYSGEYASSSYTRILLANPVLDFTIWISDVLDKNVNLEGLLDEAVSRQKELKGTYFRIVETSTNEILSGHPAYKLVFTYAYTSTDPNGNMILGDESKSMEIGTVVGDNLYRLEYEPDLQYYDYYLPAVQRMIGSFEITAKPSTETGNFSSGVNLTGSRGTNMTSQFYGPNQTLASQQPYQPQPQQNRINWGEICANPLVDYVITEPCSTLTSPDGYTLTAEGERVLRCLAGGALVGLLAPELLTQIRQLGPAVNCGG